MNDMNDIIINNHCKIAQVMILNKFQCCNSSHQNDLQYCCLRSNRMFCQRCWFIEQHPYRCNSSSCGHWQKLAHKVIQKALQMKLMQFTSQLSSSSSQYDKFIKNLLKYKIMATQQIKNIIENKLPLFLLSGMIEMLSFINPKFKSMIYEQTACSNMLRIIKRKQQNKLKNLQSIIKQMERVNFLTKGLQNKMKTKDYNGNLDREVQKIINFYEKQGIKKISDAGNQVKKTVQNQFAQLLSQYDPSIKYSGVVFNSKQNFQLVQHYNFQSLYTKLANHSTSLGNLYHGTTLQIQKLQQCPQLLLQVSKSILKQKIFNMYRNITQLKSSFPYKYGYLICTTLTPDPQYQFCVLNLQKMYIKTYEKKSEHLFLNSINLIIMGPQLITIQFKNIPKRMIDINIYGYTENRDKHYTQIIQNYIGLKGKQFIKINKYRFQNQLSLVELIYVQFQLAYEQLFTNRENVGNFEGEKYAQARGVNLMRDICLGWKNNAVIQIQVEDQDKYTPFII